MSIGIRWNGWDQSVWNLRDSYARLTDDGVEGLLGALEVDDFVRTGAALDGQVHTGWRPRPRNVLLPLLLGPAADDESFHRLDRAFWKTMRPGRVGTVTVTDSLGGARTLGLRFVNDGGLALQRDPTRNRLYKAPLRMVADDPWWYGDDVGGIYSSRSQSQFYGPTKKGPPFYVGSANTLATPTLTNPGDDDIWLKYFVEGPATRFDVTIAGDTVGASFPVPAGALLTVDSNPLRQTAVLRAADGTETDVIENLDSWGFRRLPDGEDVPLTITLNGPGRIRVSGRAKYLRGI